MAELTLDELYKIKGKLHTDAELLNQQLSECNRLINGYLQKQNGKAPTAPRPEVKKAIKEAK